MKINWNFDGKRRFTPPPCTSPPKRVPPPAPPPPRSPQISPRIDVWWFLMIFDRFWHRFWSVFWLILDGSWMDFVRCLIKIEKRRFYENERFAYTKHSFSWFQEMILEATIDRKKKKNVWQNKKNTKNSIHLFVLSLYSPKACPETMKMSVSCRRDAHFHKIAFFVCWSNLDDCWLILHRFWMIFDRCCIDFGCFFDWFGVMAGHEFCTIKLQGCCCCLHCCCFLHRFVRWFWFCQGGGKIFWSELSYFVSLKWFANIISRLFHSHTISLTI